MNENELFLTNWAEENKISLDLIKQEKITIIDKNNSHYLEFPIYNQKGKVNNIYVNLYDNTDISLSNDETNDFLGNEKNSNKNIFITENPLDRLYLLSLGQKTINLPLELNEAFFEKLEKNCPNYEKIYLSASQEKRKILLKKIESYKIALIDLKPNHSEDDKIKNDDLNLYGNSLFDLFKNQPTDTSREYILKKIMKTSSPVPLKGVFNLSDFESKVNSIYANGLKLGESTGWDCLDNYFRPKTKNITVVHGIPEHGKSTFVKCLCLNLAKKAKWKTAFFSFEDEGGEAFYHEMVEKTIGEITPFYKTTVRSKDVLNNEDFIKAKNFVNENIKLVIPDEEAGDELDALLNIFEQAVKVYDLKNIVIDPWNQIIQNRPNNMNEGDFLSICLGKVSRFAKRNNVHVFIVAHPKTMTKYDDGEYKLPTLYDISGGANWFNKVSVGICVYRNVIQQESGLNRITNIVVQKCKKRDLGKIGFCFLAMVPNSETLIDIIDQNKYKQHLRSKKNEKVKFNDFLKDTKFNKTIPVETKATQITSMNEITEISGNLLDYYDSNGEIKTSKNNDIVDPYKNNDLPF